MPRPSASLARIQQRNRDIARNQLFFVARERAPYPSEMPTQVSLWDRLWTKLMLLWARLKGAFRRG